jgi:hypothetical protein
MPVSTTVTAALTARAKRALVRIVIPRFQVQ